ncbi:hypothetical protein F7725_001260, partial [Dissostichus mawsoni]
MYAVDGRIVFCIIRWRRVRSLLLTPPDDHHAGGVGGRQQTLVAVEADVEHRAAVTLQLVHDRLRPLSEGHEGQKMLWTCCEPCWIGKLLFSCRSSSLLTQALMSSEGSLASRLIQDRAEMLQMELPSLTTRRLALVSFPVGGGGGKQQRPARKEKMLPRSSPAHRILPGASKESESTRPVSLLHPPFTFFPVEMFTTCRLLFMGWKVQHSSSLDSGSRTSRMQRPSPVFQIRSVPSRDVDTMMSLLRDQAKSVTGPAVTFTLGGDGDSVMMDSVPSREQQASRVYMLVEDVVHASEGVVFTQSRVSGHRPAGLRHRGSSADGPAVASGSLRAGVLLKCGAGAAHTAGPEAALLGQRPVAQGQQLTAQPQVLPAQTRLKATLGVLPEQLAAAPDVLSSELGERRRAVISRTRSQLPSNLRVLKSSRRKLIRKEILRSKEDSRRERSNNFQAFVKMALETLLGSCRRKHGGARANRADTLLFLTSSPLQHFSLNSSPLSLQTGLSQRQ